MEVILGMTALDRARELVMALAMMDVQVRAVASTGAEIVGHVARAPVEGVVLVEELPDGPADVCLRQLLAQPGQRPVAVVLSYRAEGRDALRAQIRSTYGLAAELVVAGARAASDLAPEVGQVLGKLIQTVRDQELAAHERLSRPVPEGVLPRPILRSGVTVYVGVSGGVGTSTVVANLAAAAAIAGRRILVVDAQLHRGPSLLYHLGVQDLPEYPGVHVLRHDYEAHHGQVGATAAAAVRQALIPVSLPRYTHPVLHLLQVPAELQNRTMMPVEHLLWAIRVLLETREYDAILVDAGSGLSDQRTAELLCEATDVMLMAANHGSSFSALLKVVPYLPALGLRTEPNLLIHAYADSGYGDRYIYQLTHLTVAGLFPHENALQRRELRQHGEAPIAITNPDLPYAQAVAALGLRFGLVDGTGATASEAAPKPRFGLFGRRG